jgi:hypothetical protein
MLKTGNHQAAMRRDEPAISEVLTLLERERARGRQLECRAAALEKALHAAYAFALRPRRAPDDSPPAARRESVT